MTAKRNAITLAELVVAVVILGIMSFIAVPRLRYSIIHRKQADTVAKQITTNMRRTRQLAITNAATNSDGFELRITGGGYQIVDSSDGSTIPNGSFTVDSNISLSGGSSFNFGPLGNLKAPSDTQLTVSSQGKSFTITIIPATGIAKCTEN